MQRAVPAPRSRLVDTGSLPELTGRRALVTGANSGIGYPTARELARAGAAVIMACRNADLGLAAVERLRAEVPAAVVEYRPLNLASLSSVRRLAESLTGPLHLLVNNAGVMAPPRYATTEDGFELQFGVNHLGHFALTGRLLPRLLEAGAARVVTVSSLAHRSGGRDVLLGNPESNYAPTRAYSNSKLANLLFGMELQRRWGGAAGRRTAPPSPATGPEPSGLTSTMAHPGISATNLFLSREGLGANPVIRIGGRLLGRVAFQSAEAGARPSLYAATRAEPGSYTGPQWPGEFRGRPGPAARTALAQDPELAGLLWDLSEEWTGVCFQP